MGIGDNNLKAARVRRCGAVAGASGDGRECWGESGERLRRASATGRRAGRRTRSVSALPRRPWPRGDAATRRYRRFQISIRH